MNIAVIYLAAGSGRRFGSNKLLHPYDGKPLYLHGLEKLIRVCSRHPNQKLCVVTRHQEILDIQDHLPVTAIYSPDSKKGISHSVHAGVAWAENLEPTAVEQSDDTDQAEVDPSSHLCSFASADACAFFVADQPHLSEETIEQFLSQMERENAQLGCVHCQGHTGNPTWFTSAYYPQLKSLTGDTGGRKILKQNPTQLHLYQVENPEELKDIDIPQDCQNQPQT